MKVWTPERGSIEMDGPYDETAGHLLIMVGANAHPTGKKLAAMKRCLKALLDD